MNCGPARAIVKSNIEESITRRMDGIDYEILGDEIQFVEIEVDPGEVAIDEAGSMMCVEAGINPDTVFGDGAAQKIDFFGKLLGPASGW